MRILIALVIGLSLTASAAAHDETDDYGYGSRGGYGDNSYHYDAREKYYDRERNPDYGRTNPYWEAWHRRAHEGDGYYPPAHRDNDKKDHRN